MTRRNGNTAVATRGRQVQRHGLELDAISNFYGSPGLIEPCDEHDLMSLSFANVMPLWDALGWYRSRQTQYIQPYLAWVTGEEIAAGGARSSWVSDPCLPRNSVAVGTHKLLIDGFSHLGRSGGTTSIYDTLNECEANPRFRLDGSQINNNFEWRSYLAMQALLADANDVLVTGDDAVSGQTDGLDVVVATGIVDTDGNPAPVLDSTVVNWGFGCESTAATATWTDGRGTLASPLASGTNIMLVIRQIVRNIKFRIRRSPQLRGQRLMPGDIFITGSHTRLMDLLECAVCWRLCADESVVYTEKGQDYLATLLGGQFGDGQIMIDGQVIPLVEGPEELGDNLYVITRKVGNVVVNYGEYQDMNQVAGSLAPEFGGAYVATDGGRFLHYVKAAETCVSNTVDWRVRLVFKAPFLCAKIVDFTGSLPGAGLSADPADTTNFYGGDITA